MIKVYIFNIDKIINLIGIHTTKNTYLQFVVVNKQYL